MMHAEADVRMGDGGGVGQLRTKGGLKITNFLRTSFMDGPYLYSD